MVLLRNPLGRRHWDAAVLCFSYWRFSTVTQTPFFLSPRMTVPPKRGGAFKTNRNSTMDQSRPVRSSRFSFNGFTSRMSPQLEELILRSTAAIFQHVSVAESQVRGRYDKSLSMRCNRVERLYLLNPTCRYTCIIKKWTECESAWGLTSSWKSNNDGGHYFPKASKLFHPNDYTGMSQPLVALSFIVERHARR